MDLLHLANAAACVVAALVLSLIVLHPHIKEGLIVKAGLIAMVIGLSATAALVFSESLNWNAYWRAGFTLRAGLAVACVGVLIKARRLASHGRRHHLGDQHHRLTTYWLNRIAEPVHDLAHLFRDERQPERRTQPEHE